eukprot:scaffold79983_cov59-Phaeocystis_antarctica.AAC.2
MPLSYLVSALSGGWCGEVDSQLLAVGGAPRPRSESTAEVIQIVESWHLAAALSGGLALGELSTISPESPGCCIRRARSTTSRQRPR